MAGKVFVPDEGDLGDPECGVGLVTVALEVAVAEELRE